VVLLTPSCYAQQKDQSVKVLSAQSFKDSIAAYPDLQLVDVRTPDEFKTAHIDGAVNIDIRDSGFMETIDALDKSAPTYVYCRSGGRSARAAQLMTEAGFVAVYDLSGGFMNY
jgi:rhodanese-related sulfurtransferase